MSNAVLSYVRYELPSLEQDWQLAAPLPLVGAEKLVSGSYTMKVGHTKGSPENPLPEPSISVSIYNPHALGTHRRAFGVGIFRETQGRDAFINALSCWFAAQGQTSEVQEFLQTLFSEVAENITADMATPHPPLPAAAKQRAYRF